ncbi:MAG: hypothetical protein ACPGU1_11435 [Myxococcota bacterium]
MSRYLPGRCAPCAALYLIVGLFVVAGCEASSSSVDTAGSGATTPGYQQLHDAIFVPSCASGSCHGGPIAVAELSFDDAAAAYAHLLEAAPVVPGAQDSGLALVAPGDLSASLLYRKLAEATEALEAESLGGRMPLGQPVLGDDALEAVATWISDGAPFDGAPLSPGVVSRGGDEADYIGCDASDADGLKACLGDAPDPSLIQRFYTPPLVIPGGSEMVMCSEVAVLDAPLRIRAARGKQMSGGHHAAVFVGLMPLGVDGPVPCSEIEMGALRFVAGAGGAGGQDTVMPDGAALTVGKGQRIVVQSHYVNMSPEPRTVMDAVDLELTTVAESPIDVDAFAVIDSELAIPTETEAYTRVKTCKVDAPMDIHMMLGHTHDYGVLFEIEFIRDGLPELQYHATHGPTLRDTPDILMFDEPLHLDEGDEVRITCAWTNTTDDVLGWPEEMCVGLMYYSPGRGYLICDTDDEVPVVQGGGEASPDEGCVGPGAEGNALGVGRYCTVGGGECDDTPEPTLCLAEFDSDAPYCSVILCQDDSVCGDGATCVFEGAGSACVPDACR